MPLKRELGFFTAALVIVASMIGGGIFYLPQSIMNLSPSGWEYILLFVIGGAIAITGSMSYAELATIIPEDGGEYQFLKKIFGHLPAFLTGWISLLVGFTASIAMAGLTLQYYLIPFLDVVLGTKEHWLHNKWIFRGAVSCFITILGSMHIIGVKFGSRIQNMLTVIKVCIILSLIIAGFVAFSMTDFSTALTFEMPKSQSHNFGGFMSALIMVMYVFSGWNGATYIAGEMKDPERNLPKALFWATFITMIIYILLNLVFITALTPSKLANNYTFGAQTAQALYGAKVTTLYNFFITIILFSSISAQLMIGPRVYFKMAQDKILFSSLAKIHPKTNTPVIAIMVQIVLSILYVFSVNPDTLVNYMGFALSIFPILTVGGLIYWRHKFPDIKRPYKVFAYPITPIIFIGSSIIMLIASLINGFQNPKHNSLGYMIAFAVIEIGFFSFYVWDKKYKSLFKNFHMTAIILISYISVFIIMIVTQAYRYLNYKIKPSPLYGAVLITVGMVVIISISFLAWKKKTQEKG